MFLYKHMKDFEVMINNGLYINRIGKIEFKLVGFIADAPAIAKTLNCMQYNGSYGCIHCMNDAKCW